jgi:uncharacterized protein (TIGR03437 family)
MGSKNSLLILSGMLLFWLLPAATAQSNANWTEQTPQTSPPGRNSSAMVYDSAHGQAVLFGGFNGNATGFGDTWIWDGTNWTQEAPGTSPSARYTHAMAYDSKHQQTVMFGGQNPGLTSDTWVWEGTDWTEMTPVANPSARFGHVMAFDSAHGRVVLFGGETLAVEVLNDTWLWDGTNWTQQQPKNSPHARYYMAAAFDSAHGQVVLFEGADTNGDVYGDTWVWDGTNWTQMNPSASPSPRLGHAMAYDSTHGQVILYGGTTEVIAGTILGDTWTWDGANWTQQSPQSSPPASNFAVLAYDSMHNDAVLFGGYDGSFAADTWTWIGAAAAAGPVVTAVVNGASFVGGGVVPGEIATAFGTNLTSSTGINLTSGLPLPATFLTDALMVNDKPVALFAVDNVNGQQQVNFQVPWEVASGPMATVAVSNNGTAGASISVPVLKAQPGIFNYSVGGETFGAILHANFQLANTANPAKPSETVLIYCTGLGAVESPPADGAESNGQTTMAMPTVTIGGTKAIVSFSGLAPTFVGLYQVNAEVPATVKAGNQAVVVEVGAASSNSVLLPVQ